MMKLTVLISLIVALKANRLLQQVTCATIRCAAPNQCFDLSTGGKCCDPNICNVGACGGNAAPGVVCPAGSECVAGKCIDPDATAPVACTKDAKICPDGTAVGRDGNNNCEFFPCPVGCGINFCTSYYDGCNSCGCNNGVTSFCTLRFCGPDEFGDAYCTGCEDGYSLISNVCVKTPDCVPDGATFLGDNDFCMVAKFTCPDGYQHWSKENCGCGCEPIDISCPTAQPNPGDACTFKGSCAWGQETCCGETFDSFECSCVNGQALCLNTDACFGAPDSCADSCPVEQANPGDKCNWTGTCAWGKESCCGNTYDSFKCQCIGGEAACFYTDACAFVDSCPVKPCTNNRDCTRSEGYRCKTDPTSQQQVCLNKSDIRCSSDNDCETGYQCVKYGRRGWCVDYEDP